MFKYILTIASILFLTACGTYQPCDPDKLNCDNGTRSTGGRVSAPSAPVGSINAPAKGPSESNNPGKPSTGGPVGPSKPSHGGKPGHGHGDKNHGHKGPPGKHNSGKGK